MPSKKTEKARKLRKNPTEAEKCLWSKLRYDQFGVRFRRQHPVDRYVLDFYCHDLKLAIEVDGGQHAQNMYDEQRDNVLKNEGITVLRYWNNDVLNNIDGVVEDIRKKIPLSQPSPPKGERTFEAYRADFPVLAKAMNGRPLAFLDTAASAQKPQSVIDAMDAVLEGGYSNIHRGLYRISQDLTADFEAVRAKIARFIGAKSEKEIIFTRNSTESINLVAQTWGRTHLKPADEVILTAMEHHANIVPWQLLQKEIGFTIKVIPLLDTGALDLENFATLLSEKTKLVACVHVSNGFGVINNINKIIELSHKLNPESKVLIDGSQGIVHAPVDVSAMDADFYVFTGHKLYGPTGIGVLYGKYEVLEDMPPYQGGGDMIERVSFDGTTFKEPPYRFEAGTPPIVEVIGLGAAIDYVEKVGYDFITAHEATLRDYGHERLREINGLKLYGIGAEKAGIFSFTMDCAHPSDIGMILDQCGVAVRAGHHCCMPLMQRFGLDATVRASLGLYSNRQDIDQLIEGLHKVKELFA